MQSSKEVLQVAIVGGGPSGFFVAESLLNSGAAVDITILDRLPTPYGLVRYGVAPDHQKLKGVSLTLDAIAQHPNVTFLGNVKVGSSVLTLKQLKSLYHIVVMTTGMPLGTQLGLEGEDLSGVHTASEFIGWYNGHPDYQDKKFDFSQETAVIIGQGNVAIDVCRVLSKSIDELRKSDIPEQALEALSYSNIKRVHMVGRRGPVQAKFTTKELHELGKLESCHVTVDPYNLNLGMACHVELNEVSNQMARKNHSIYEAYSGNFGIIPEAHKTQISIDFMLNPKAFKGTSKLQSVVFDRTRLEGAAFSQTCSFTGEQLEIPCGLAFTSVGFRGVELGGLTLNPKNGTLSNRNSRLLDKDGQVIPGMYAAGWVKRGPQGVIGTNRECAEDTVTFILRDLPLYAGKYAPGKEALLNLLYEKNVQYVTFKDWKIIDEVEISRGQLLGKPREKFTNIEDMLACI
jgi:NADPH-dependent glutamate synthase beta subunit-like oxidoreductase